MLLRDFTIQLTHQSSHLSATLTVADFVQFASLAAEVEHRAGPSLRLTPNQFSVVPFLEESLSVQFPSDLLNDLWRITFPVLRMCRIDTTSLIRDFGLQPNLTTKLPERFLRTPLSHCLVCSKDNPRPLHIHSHLNGYLHDIDGVHPVQTIIHSCSNPECDTMYRPSYYTRDGCRYYYTKEMGRNVDYLHINTHYYMTRRMAYMFRVLQMLAHVSHFNLVNWYNMIFVDETPAALFTPNQLFTPSMSEEECRNGLMLHSLIKHADRRGTTLVVSSSGTDKIRFESAIETHLQQLLIEGTKYRDHYCSTCVRLLPDGVDPVTGESFYKSIRAVVTDGLTIGHWRCSATTDQLVEIARSSGRPLPEGPCTNKLNNVNDRFCPEHFAILGGRCRAQPCPHLAAAHCETCEDPEHIKQWADFKERVKGNFSLTAILNRPGLNLHPDPTPHLDAETGNFQDLESLQQADESQQAHEAAHDGGESAAAGKYVLSRSRTHNDQIIVAPCGITLARKTFYHAESVSAVREFLEETFPRGMPEVVFYDNACRLTEHIYTAHSDPSRFEGTVIPVDPFHHRSHAETDQFCKMFTDPKLFPDIQENGQWIFNASAAELTNIWYGGFASMCRNMSSLVYNFFLEEMVYLRNKWLTKKLEKRAGMAYIGEGAI